MCECVVSGFGLGVSIRVGYFGGLGFRGLFRQLEVCGFVVYVGLRWVDWAVWAGCGLQALDVERHHMLRVAKAGRCRFVWEGLCFEELRDERSIASRPGLSMNEILTAHGCG